MALSKPVARTKGRDPTEEEIKTIRQAADDDDVKLMEGLMKSGINVTDANLGNNWTALHEAAAKGSNKILSILIRSGANHAITTTLVQSTPLHEAASNGHTNCVALLVANGADVNMKNDFQYTPLHWAASNGHTNCVALLVANGADVNMKNGLQWTPLHYAAMDGHTNCVALLVANGADVNMKDRDGITPLQLAVMNNHSSVVSYLINKVGVKTTQYNKRTQDQIRWLLKEAETSTESMDKHDKSPDSQESLAVMLTKLEQAKANNETLKVSYTTVVFSGSSGVGKTSLFNKLNKEKLSKQHHSTGVAKSRHTICVKTAAVVESTQGLCWVDLDHDSVIRHLNKHLQSLKFPSAKPSTLQSQEHTDQKNHHSQIPSISTEVLSSEGNALKSSSSVKITKELEIDIAGADSSTTPSLGDVWDIINFLDTGGQPEFVNILPAVSSSIALTLIVFNLSESLNDLVHVKHNVNGDPTFEPYHLDCTNLEFIKRLMVSSENFNKNITPSVVLKGIQRKSCAVGAKICYIGTHALQVNDKKIKEIDHTLSSIARELELQQRSFWSSPKQELKRLFPIDLFPDDKESFENIIEHLQKNIQNEVKAQDYYEVPITWFIFLLKVQKLCAVKKVSYISYQEADDAWIEDNGNKEKSNKSLCARRENSDVHNVLLFFHLMGMLFYYHRVKGMCDFVFVDRQWLFEKLTKLVEIKFTKGYSREDVSAEDIENFTMKGRLSINIIKQLNIDLQGISPLCFVSLLDHLNIIAPINSTDYFMPCVLPSFSDIKCLDDLDKCYGTIQHVPLLVGFKNGPMPHGFFCHLIVELFRNLPNGWDLPFLSTEERQHVYNNLITFPAANGHFVSIFYKIGYLEIQLRHQECQPAIHSDVQQEVDKSLRVVSDYLQLNQGLICYGFYCSCRDTQHFVKLDKLTLPMEYIRCRYSSTKLTDDHKVWLQDINCHKFEQEIKLIMINNDQPNYQNLLPYFEDVSNWKQLGLYLLPKKYNSRINDIERNYPQDIAQCRWALITEFLKVGEISWYKIINAFEKSGNPNIAKKIRKDMLNIAATPSADHKRHDQLTTCDIEKATKPLASHEDNEHSPDTNASNADLCIKPSTEQRGHVQSHTTAASKPSTKRRCSVM